MDKTTGEYTISTRDTPVLADSRSSFILWSECCRYTDLQEVMRKQFLGPIDSSQK